MEIKVDIYSNGSEELYVDGECFGDHEGGIKLTPTMIANLLKKAYNVGNRRTYEDFSVTFKDKA